MAASINSMERAKTLADRLPSPLGARHYAVFHNQMDEAHCNAGFTNAIEKANKLDVLVNNGAESCGQDHSNVIRQQFARHQLTNRQ